MEDVDAGLLPEQARAPCTAGDRTEKREIDGIYVLKFVVIDVD